VAPAVWRSFNYEPKSCGMFWAVGGCSGCRSRRCVCATLPVGPSWGVVVVEYHIKVVRDFQSKEWTSTLKPLLHWSLSQLLVVTENWFEKLLHPST
jgi:hypothetical protein